MRERKRVMGEERKLEGKERERERERERGKYRGRTREMT